MRKLFTLTAICFATAIAGGVSISPANASPLTGVVHSLNVKPAASSRRRTIIIAIIAALLAAIIAVPIIMALLAQPITVVIITIIGMLTMAVFIIAIIAVLLAVLIAGVIITETVGVALGWSRAHTRGQSSPRSTRAPLTGAFFLERRRVTTAQPSSLCRSVSRGGLVR